MALGASVLALIATWAAANRTGRQKAKAGALRRTITALQPRERVDDAINQDPDLAARARCAGRLRDELE